MDIQPKARAEAPFPFRTKIKGIVTPGDQDRRIAINRKHADSISHTSEIIVRTFARLASPSTLPFAVPAFTDWRLRNAIRDMTSDGMLIPQRHKSPAQLIINVTRLCVERPLYLEASAD